MKKKSAPKSRAPKETPDSRWDGLAKDIVMTLCRRRPILATRLGIHDFDGDLPEPSREAVREEIHLLHDWQKRIESFPARGLSLSLIHI